VSFEQEEIGLDIVQDLCEVHLERLGVTSMGERLRLKRAIEALQKPEEDLRMLSLTLQSSMAVVTEASHLLNNFLTP
jgi:hypothetical protein